MPNDLLLDVGAALVISGPNTGGKTVALKTLGICCLMAQAGLRLPTKTAAFVPLVRRIVRDVGDDQSIAANLSTFSAHMRHVIEALASAAADGAGTLVLLDEVAVGTEPEQGAALAESILLDLTQHGATVVTTTHYERLKLVAVAHPGRFVNASVGLDIAAMRPTFRLLLGVPGPSSALTVARRLGLPERVLAHAASLRDDERLQVDALLQQVVSERDALITARADVEKERRSLADRAREVARREAALLEQSKSRKQKAYDQAAGELRALQGELTEQRKVLRKAQKAGELPAVANTAETLAAKVSEARAQLAELQALFASLEALPELPLGTDLSVAVVTAIGQGTATSTTFSAGVARPLPRWVWGLLLGEVVMAIVLLGRVWSALVDWWGTGQAIATDWLATVQMSLLGWVNEFWLGVMAVGQQPNLPILTLSSPTSNWPALTARSSTAAPTPQRAKA